MNADLQKRARQGRDSADLFSPCSSAACWLAAAQLRLRDWFRLLDRDLRVLAAELVTTGSQRNVRLRPIPLMLTSRKPAMNASADRRHFVRI